jgi:SpoVK/Ycf46/Vps4 family AAA+-type ATPase
VAETEQAPACEALRLAIAESGKTYEEVAAQLGTSRQSLSGWVNCRVRPDLDARRRVAEKYPWIRVRDWLLPSELADWPDTTFDSTVGWDEIYLPGALKDDIIKDIDAFFKKGVDIYTRLNIKPFRKLLFAGVPGTGKTMLCSAIAGWGSERDYFVVYVSGSNQYGAKFWKIHEALDMAASSDAPTIVIVEELDSYLDEDDKAQLLNVLDGSESPHNKHGTIMIATTNHPEKIDDRVMKRPGRLDRIFIIPEMEHEETARKMLMQYLGDAWHADHAEIVPKMLGRPGAFIREVALYALTMAAYAGETELSLAMLRTSLDTLVNQIEAKDDFLTSHKKQPMGLAAARKARRNGFRIHDE